MNDTCRERYGGNLFGDDSVPAPVSVSCGHGCSSNLSNDGCALPALFTAVVNCSAGMPALHEADSLRPHGAGTGAVDELVFSAFRALSRMSKAPRARVIFGAHEGRWVLQGAWCLLQGAWGRVPNTMPAQNSGSLPPVLLQYWGIYSWLRRNHQDCW